MWPFSKPKPKAKPAAPEPVAGVHAPVLKALAPWIKRHARTTWRPIVSEPRDARPPVSHFGGLPTLRQGEAAPLCGVCEKPIDLFLQLDGRETPEGSPWHGPMVLQFFYCRACEVEHQGWEAFSRAHVLRAVPAEELAVSPPEGATVPSASAATPPSSALPPLGRVDIVGWTAIPDAPQPVEHDGLGIEISYDFKAGLMTLSCPSLGVRFADLNVMATDEDGKELAEALGTAADGDKLGGWPHWIQNDETPRCPRCTVFMTYVFQVDSETNIDHMFGDSGCGHIFQCPQHPDVLAFAWACC